MAIQRTLIGLLGAVTLVLALTQLMMLAGWMSSKHTPQKSPSLEADVENLSGMDEAQRQQLLKNALQTLRSDPLNPATIQNLSVLTLLGQSGGVSDSLVKALARTSIRNSTIQFGAIRLLLADKNYGEALYRIDGILRAHPTLSDQLFPLLSGPFSSPEQIGQLAEKLAENPQWRPAYFRYLAKGPNLEDVGLRTVRKLSKSASPASAIELNRLFEAWAKGPKGYGFSYFAWLDMLEPDAFHLVRGIFDGDFVRDPRNLMFEWNLKNSANSQVRIVPRPEAPLDRVLAVDFANSRERFQNVSQVMQLTAGSYSISFEMLRRNLKTEGGLVWRVYCIGRSEKIGESQAISQSSEWEKQSFAVTVPETGCATQMLRLESKASNALDLLISGQVYFDKFAVQQVSEAEN